MREHITLTTAPVRRPVSLAEVKDNLRIDSDDDDTVIDQLINDAVTQVENLIRRPLINRTLTVRFDDFCALMELPKPPLVSVTSVKYTDTDGATQTVDTSVYHVDIYGMFGNVQLVSGQQWPLVGSYPAPVQIEYVAGYGANPQDTPSPARRAILLLIGHWFENREALAVVQLKPVPMGVNALLSPLRVWGH